MEIGNHFSLLSTTTAECQTFLPVHRVSRCLNEPFRFRFKQKISKEEVRSSSSFFTVKNCCQWIQPKSGGDKCMVTGIKYKCMKDYNCEQCFNELDYGSYNYDYDGEFKHAIKPKKVIGGSHRSKSFSEGKDIKCPTPTKLHVPKKNCMASKTLHREVISKFIHENETLVELLGPSNLDTSSLAAIILTVTHGGSLRPEYIPNRHTQGPYCTNAKTKKCIILNDLYTKDISISISNQIMTNFCKVPFLVINHLHRSKLDANRDVVEGAQGDVIAKEVWYYYHEYIQKAQTIIMDLYGVVENNVRQNGIKGVLLDIHGYSGYDWTPLHIMNYNKYYDYNENKYITDEGMKLGSPFIQWGYRLSKETLDLKNDNTHLDTTVLNTTMSTLAHGRYLPNQSLECLIRGPNSIGSRLLESITMDPVWMDLYNCDSLSNKTKFVICGTGLPSYEYPNPNKISNSSLFCHNSNSTLPSSCRYFTGGYSVHAHKYYHDWIGRNNSTLIMNTVQMELPRCIRFGEVDVKGDKDEIIRKRKAIHKRFSYHLSIVLCSFLRDLYEDEGLC